MKIFLIITGLFTSLVSTKSCSLLFCENFETITSWYAEGDLLYIDVTSFTLAKIDKKRKKLLYTHNDDTYDFDINVLFDDNGYVFYSSLKSNLTGYQAEVCIEDMYNSNFHPREQFDIEIANHVSCFLGDCLPYYN